MFAALISVVRAVSRWSDVADWRSWVVHGTLTIPLMLVFGAWPVIVFYFLREGEQVLHRLMNGVPLDSLDHVMDVTVPVLVVALVELLR